MLEGNIRLRKITPKKEQLMENTLRENRMGTDKIPKALFSLAVPIIISMLVQALYNIVDSVFVAKFDPVAGTAALTIAFPIQNLMIAVAAGLGVGMNAVLSRSLGQKNYEKANAAAGQGLVLTVLASLIFVVFGLFFVEPYAKTQAGDNPLSLVYAVDYISFIATGSTFVFIQVTTERLLQSTGKSIFSMITQGTGAIVNIILDPILIFGYCGLPEMGVKGAAIATVIGQFTAALLGVIFNLTVNKEIKFAPKYMKPNLSVLKEILIIGIPSVFMQAIGSLMTFSMNFILISLDPSSTALNVFGIYFKLQSFVFMPIFGLTNGMIPIVSYNYGANKRDRVFATIKLSAVSAVSYMLLGFIVFQSIPTVLLGFFEAGEAMLKIGKIALRIISISFIFAGFAIISSSVCQALGKSVYSLLLSVARQLVVLIPAAFLLSLTGKVSAVWWAFPIAECISLILATIFLIRVLKKAFGKQKEEL